MSLSRLLQAVVWMATALPGLAQPSAAVVVNSASYVAGSIAPDQLVSAFGSGFSTDTILAFNQPSTQPLPTTLGDTTISITDSNGNTVAAPIIFVSPRQVNFLVPASLASGAATVNFMRSGATILTASVTVAPVVPGIFTANGNGAGVVAGVFLIINGRANMIVSSFPTYQCGPEPLSCVAVPFTIGTVPSFAYALHVYGTGLRAAKSVKAYIGEHETPVFLAAEPYFAGLDVISIGLEALSGTGETTLYIVADGVKSNIATLKIL